MNASWMLYLDADEFLCINMLTKDKTPVTVKQLLCQWHFADAVSVNWLIFGTNGHKTQPSGLLMENFTKSEMYLDKHVKTFVRPNATKYVKDPHTYKLYNSVRYFSVDGKPKLETPFHYINKIFTQVPAYIAHYYVQSEAEFKRRKCRAMDNGSPAYSSQIDHSFFLTGNAVVNNKLSCLYATRIKECLHYNHIVSTDMGGIGGEIGEGIGGMGGAGPVEYLDEEDEVDRRPWHVFKLPDGE